MRTGRYVLHLKDVRTLKIRLDNKSSHNLPGLVFHATFANRKHIVDYPNMAAVNACENALLHVLSIQVVL